ncbi:MAG: Na/Pi cotransporter family protein [Clostridia bacterium]|nr:Na/Pi cotransporter family protein [Clostridia bacterium]
MDIFDALQLIGGLALFLFGMNVMGQALERRAGNSLRSLLSKLTSNPWAGLLTGMGVTAVIQSSSATTVMVVGFVNSGIMTLRQAINVIMGANIGTTVTAWLLSLTGIDSGNTFVKLLKPSSFTPVLAIIGLLFFLAKEGGKKRDTGSILLGFATLMYGMEIMSGAVSGLTEVPAFQQLFVLFTNPILGVLAGAVLTAIIQSSSASVGILQTLALAGGVSYGAAIPIIMGQNIGTCVTAILSAFGANKNAKRAALVHLSFNILGTAILLGAFCMVKSIVNIEMLNDNATVFGIAVAHSAFNLLCTFILFPFASLLEKLVCRLVPDGQTPDTVEELDERLLATPPIALQRCHTIASDMAHVSALALKDSLSLVRGYDKVLAAKVREKEDKTDHYEDILGTYLVKLSTRRISGDDSAEAAKLLKIIGDFERISDHAVEIVCAAEEMEEKGLSFSEEAKAELEVLLSAVAEIVDKTADAFVSNDLVAATEIEPLEQVIDRLKETLRTRHIQRLQKEMCTIDIGFVWTDLLAALERVSDHCSNVAGCVLEISQKHMNIHETLRSAKAGGGDFNAKYEEYREKYALK